MFSLEKKVKHKKLVKGAEKSLNISTGKKKKFFSLKQNTSLDINQFCLFVCCYHCYRSFGIWPHLALKKNEGKQAFLSLPEVHWHVNDVRSYKEMQLFVMFKISGITAE